MKQSIIAIIVIFIVWSIIDFIVHNILLMPIYVETKDLWRPADEMKILLMYGVTFIYAACFV